MNKKKIILLFILTLIGILCVFLNGKEEPEVGVGQNKVSFSNKTNSFYYDQLDETEKRVCNDITALVEQGNGGKIDLTAPISTYRYLRIVRTLSFDHGQGDQVGLVLFEPLKPCVYASKGKNDKYNGNTETGNNK